MDDKSTVQPDPPVAKTPQRELVRAADEAPPTPSAGARDQRPPTQKETLALVEPTTSRGALAEYPKAQALYDVSEIGIRGTGMVILRSVVQEMEYDLRQTKIELKNVIENYHAEHRENAVLEVQLRAERRIRILQNVLITVGGLVNAVGVKLVFDAQQRGEGCLFLFVGLTLTTAGWLWPKGGEEKP